MFFILGFSFVVRAADPLVIAHRGASYISPEETRPSYLMAALLGADFLEADIHRSKDGVLFAFHDLNFKRITDIKKVFPKRERDLPGSFTWEEIQKLDAGSAYNTKNKSRARSSFAGLNILSLSEIIDIADSFNGIGLYLETKTPEFYPGIEKQILDLLNEKSWVDAEGNALKPLVLESFSRESVTEFAKLAPGVPRTFLLTTFKFYQWKSGIKFAKDVKANLGVPQWTLYFPPYLVKFLESGVDLHPWTLDKKMSLKIARNLKAAAIFTNRPEVAVPFFKQTPQQNLDEVFKSIGY
jgi:glycerophosphoryl diester phosphodiesterase